MKDKKFRKSRDVTVIVSNSIIKDVKDWELTDDQNKVVVKSFRGATTSQMKRHVNPTTELNPKNIILHCSTNDMNDESDPQNIAKNLSNWPNQCQKIVTVT